MKTESFKVNPFNIMKNAPQLKDIDVYIDNTKLEGFIDYFLETDCRGKSCDECGYCMRMAEKAVRIGPAYSEKAIGEYGRFY